MWRSFASTGDNSEEICDQVYNRILYGGTSSLPGTPGNYLCHGRKGVYKSMLWEAQSSQKSVWAAPHVRKWCPDQPRLTPFSSYRRKLSPWVGRSRPLTRKRGQPIHSAKHPTPVVLKHRRQLVFGDYLIQPFCFNEGGNKMSHKMLG